MQITFDTTNITDDEVRGIFALLDTVRPTPRIKTTWDAGYITKAQEDEGVREELTETAEKGWVGEKITKLTETGEEVSREPIPTHDANGLPWHPDIHSGTKALNADGTWRTKRGVDKALVAEVEAELRQTYISELDAANERVAELTGVEDAQIVAPPAPPAPEAPPAPLAPAVTQSAPSSAVSPFVALMKRVTTAQGAGKLTQPRVKELLESLDKKSIMDLRTDEDALASFAVLLTAELNGTLAEVAEACGGLKPENIKSILAILPGEGV